MAEQMLAVKQRRGELLARIAAQREQLAEIGARWQTPLAIADQCVAAACFLRARPLLVGGIVALFVLRRNGAIRLFRSALLVWKGYRYFTGLRQRLADRIG